MTTPIAIADRAMKLLFYGLILAAPACGDAALNQAHALIARYLLPAAQ